LSTPAASADCFSLPRTLRPGREVIDYSVVVAVWHAGQRKTVRVYDGAHGVNETPSDPPLSPASIAMDEAIELAIEGRSPYPDRALFLDADAPHIGRAIAEASDEDRAVILCYADGTRRVLQPAPPVAAA
jgi:hypothetical protein